METGCRGGSDACFMFYRYRGLRELLGPACDAPSGVSGPVLPHPAGRAFVDLYYRYSPPMADFIREHEPLQSAAQWVLTPLVYGIAYPLGAVVFLFAGIGTV